MLDLTTRRSGLIPEINEKSQWALRWFHGWLTATFGQSRRGLYEYLLMGASLRSLQGCDRHSHK
ncbi:MAG: hypothetical protein KFF72_02930 [Arthrospira sp. SH-MAG29]|nr:hypothetical protein [Arthrospira sp. SH-MAG29]MBS0015320.1 hypothetical protein [Arthrospira sp. SH-MAG29]